MTRNTTYKEAEHVYYTETLSSFKSERKLLVGACLASFYAISNKSSNARRGLLSDKQTQAGSRGVYGYRILALRMIILIKAHVMARCQLEAQTLLGIF